MQEFAIRSELINPLSVITSLLSAARPFTFKKFRGVKINLFVYIEMVDGFC